MEPSLLQLICCPEDRTELRPATEQELLLLNDEIAAGRVQNRGGQQVEERLIEGLVRADGRWCYPVREGIPVLLIDEAVKLQKSSDTAEQKG